MKSILLFVGLMLSAQSIVAQTVRGTVCDASTHEPLAGATVVQKDTRNGTSADAEGRFRLRLLSAPETVLVVRFVGYQTQDVVVEDPSASLDLCLSPAPFQGDEVLVQGVRVDERSAVTHSNIAKEDIEERNLGRDLPYVLETLPSVVTTSDAGAGVGYTGMRIRGVDQARINVTINGIPLNEAESHEVFWVNMPDFASSVQSMQVQRGVGTSTNGAAAFGASVNIQTDAASRDPHGSVTSAIGSFNTKRVSLETGTGLLDGQWSLDGRLSATASDGYIDRAFSDLNSWFVTGARTGSRSQLKVNVFSGKERTYQAWNGVPEWELEENRRFNEFDYDNQTDNYRQTHSQLHYSLQLAPTVNLHAALHYTRGAGYYEEYRGEDDLADYGIAPVVVEGNTILQSDLIRRRWLDNHFYGTVASVDVRPSDRLNVTVGGAYNVYDGDHFGEVIWARFAGDSEIRDRYYDNNGLKHDGSGYVKATYRITPAVDVFGDLQLRGIRYEFLGLNDNGEPLDQTVNYSFFNPKAGINLQVTPTERVYAGFGVAQKEPTRKEFTESSPGTRPLPERLHNVEAGIRTSRGNIQAGIGGYWMDYHNQLILTGEVNDVGSYIRSNVKDSYRLGLEMDAAWQALPSLSLNGTLTLSRNRIPTFREYLDVYEGDDWVGQQEVVWDDAPIAFSPEVIAGAGVNWSPAAGVNLGLQGRHIGRQHLDNTGTRSRSLDAYTVADVNASYRIRIPNVVDMLELQLSVYNVGDALYESNGYTFGWLQDGDRVAYNYYYPQAGRHVMAQVRVGF